MTTPEALEGAARPGSPREPPSCFLLLPQSHRRRPRVPGTPRGQDREREIGFGIGWPLMRARPVGREL
eukprot:8544282-Pyramimonas_sp.AAC.1